MALTNGCEKAVGRVHARVPMDTRDHGWLARMPICRAWGLRKRTVESRGRVIRNSEMEDESRVAEAARVAMRRTGSRESLAWRAQDCDGWHPDFRHDGLLLLQPILSGFNQELFEWHCPARRPTASASGRTAGQ